MKKVLAVMYLMVLVVIGGSCNSLKTYSCSPIYAMDTIIKINFYNTKDYDKYYKEIKNIYQNYDLLASDFSNSSLANVYELNEKRSITASKELIDLLKCAVDCKDLTDGYYNPFIGRLSHLWKEAIKEKRVVPSDIIENELAIMNSTSLAIEGNKCSLIGDGNIDLGGIAKGYATKVVEDYLKKEGITRYLINAGESSIALGDKNGDYFKVALSKPYDNGVITSIKAKNTSISTSSGRYQHVVIDDVLYHHLLNPFTGMPSLIYDNVNIMMKDSMLCDVYSTAIFSMDLNTAKAFADENDIDILLYKNKEILYESQGFIDGQIKK